MESLLMELDCTVWDTV